MLGSNNLLIRNNFDRDKVPRIHDRWHGITMLLDFDYFGLLLETSCYLMD